MAGNPARLAGGVLDLIPASFIGVEERKTVADIDAGDFIVGIGIGGRANAKPASAGVSDGDVRFGKSA